MKKNILKISFFILLNLQLQAQIQPVYSTNSQFSDNLDLRAVASIFGDAQNVEDFERRLNDPFFQISNLDLNGDNRVDYLRVIETINQNIHLVIIQAIVNFNNYQDVATIEIQRDFYRNFQIQIVGNQNIYGPNYIYEPVYYRSPLIFNALCRTNYSPYASNWRWNYYPKTYRSWNPCPIVNYRNNLQVSINMQNRYNYVTNRRFNTTNNLYRSSYSNGYENFKPSNNFLNRNNNYNSQELIDRKQENLTNNNYRNISTERNYDNTDPNRYGANRASYNQRVQPESGGFNRLNLTNDLNQQNNENNRGNNNRRIESNLRESNKESDQSNRTYFQNNNTTRENQKQEERNTNRGFDIGGDRENQSPINRRGGI